MDQTDYEKFVHALTEHLYSRTDSQVLVLLRDVDGSIETMQNNSDVVWARGMLATAEDIFRQRVQELRDREREQVAEKRAIEEMNHALSAREKEN